jgi:oligopeptide transport system substrate-binding protein
MGEFIQQELKKIGINIQIETLTFPTFLDKSRKGELQFWQGGWVMDYPDAENMLQLLYSGNFPPGPNSSHYANKEFDLLFEQFKYLEDGEQKFQLMFQMEDIINSELPWILQYYSRNYILYHHYLTNFRYSDITYNSLKYLRFKSE